MNGIEPLVKKLVSQYVVNPAHLKTFWSKGALFLQPHDGDYRLIIGRSGRNLEALRTVSNFMSRPSATRIEVIEPEGRADICQPRPLVENSDWPTDLDKPFIDCITGLLKGTGAYLEEPEVDYPEEYTTCLSAKTLVEIDPLTRQAISILFGAIGRIRGRNVRVQLRWNSTP